MGQFTHQYRWWLIFIGLDAAAFITDVQIPLRLENKCPDVDSGKTGRGCEKTVAAGVNSQALMPDHRPARYQ